MAAFFEGILFFFFCDVSGRFALAIFEVERDSPGPILIASRNIDIGDKIVAPPIFEPFPVIDLAFITPRVL